MDWLEQHAPGFEQLSVDERTAIMEFSFFWSLFEAKVLNTNANFQTIKDATQHWYVQGLLTEELVHDQLAYFRGRYCPDGKFTHHFDHLHLPVGEQRDIVVRVLRDGAEVGDTVAALLLIVYRYRNNLFHGVKWSYGIKGQLKNFYHANFLLMRSIELHEQSAPST